MIRRPPRSTRTDTLFPYTTLFRSSPRSFIPYGAVTALGGGAVSFLEDTTMLPSSNPTPVLYRIDECSDLMADACVCNEQGEFIFLSVWARDRSEERRVGKECVSTCRSRWSPYHKKKHMITNDSNTQYDHVTMTVYTILQIIIISTRIEV